MLANLMRPLAMIAALLLPVALVPAAHAAGPEPAVVIPPPEADLAPTEGLHTFVLAGGCFWGVQAVFQHVEGVTAAISGYSGGSAETAKYNMVTTGRTGHAESVEITYDPSVVSYGKLLQIYFSVAHNPTQLNYQGPDHGTHYRSAVFVSNDEEREVVEAYIAQLDAAGVFPAKIVTTIEPLEAFYAAEDYHQDYVWLNPRWPYVVIHDLPKLANLEQIFPDVHRKIPVLVDRVR